VEAADATNIVKLRHGDFPVFVEIAQVIAGYQLQTTVAGGFSAQNYITTGVGGPAAIAGTAAVGATYVDRPTVIYAPLTGNDFIKKLMSPVPPSAVLFLLQSGYSAVVVMPLTIDSINGIANESRRARAPETVSDCFAPAR
jgi:cell division ATPase FtsA